MILHFHIGLINLNLRGFIFRDVIVDSIRGLYMNIGSNEGKAFRLVNVKVIFGRFLKMAVFWHHSFLGRSIRFCDLYLWIIGLCLEICENNYNVKIYARESQVYEYILRLKAIKVMIKSDHSIIKVLFYDECVIWYWKIIA